MIQTLFEWYELTRETFEDRTHVMPVPGGALIRQTCGGLIEGQQTIVSMVFVPGVDVRRDADGDVYLTGLDNHDAQLVARKVPRRNA